MHVGLHAWDRRVLKKPKHRLRSAQRYLETVMRGPINSENEHKNKEIPELIEKLLEQEEIRWSQRSRANWLQNGDRNTSYFHSFATARKKRNYIKKLKNIAGDFVEGNDNLSPIIQSYFTNLFSIGNDDIDPTF
jgi:hypothetical protein